MPSPCCHAPTSVDAWGIVLCTSCWATVPEKRLQERDIIAWLFPPEQKPRPTCEPVFVRYGQKLERLEGGVRGKPDGWFWCDA